MGSTVFRQIGAPEIILILAVVVLLFGAKKLPELARGSGRALRIFKAETKGLVDDDDETTAPPAAPRAIPPGEAAPGPVAAHEVPPAERKPDSAD
ncbi:Sec-independent protein translocase subunit TatA [Nocardioides pocheonensis]|uniref:Sec-independent protein translocase protein TatA n=1 Tax=Nocardioides pocheonensis TaxID=661485 RepID=A0A3N0GPJ2_9ACTN|nr:Sec-independent protein translocase subunit TatA [Nocardioides pocheonensis]